MSERESSPSSGEATIVDAVDVDAPSRALVGSSGLSYRPLKQLGEGGMAQVFLACAYGNADFSKLVVLKIMRDLEHPHLREMFLEEARVSARLNHPNLVQVYEVADAGDLPFMVMEYLEGKPLTKLRGAVLPREMLLTIVSEALVGLHYAHEATDFDGGPLKLVHRDVSPHNIFITYDGAVKILDFGIAKTVSGKGHTQTGEVKGKLSYMAPEQLLGEDLDRRADIFSMGAVLWEMMLGSTLWSKVEQGVLIQRLASGEIPRPIAADNLDPELEAILVRATAAEPADRYQTALEMQQAIDAYRGRIAKFCTPREVGAALAARFEAERNAERHAIRAAVEAPSVPPPRDSYPAGAVAEAASAESRRRVSPWLIAFAAFVAISFGVSRMLANRATQLPSSSPTAVNSLEPPARTARLSFQVSPPESEVRIDGALRGTGSFELVVVADAREHEVTVSAAHYSTLKQRVRFEGTQALNVVLAASSAPEPASDQGSAANAKSARSKGTPSRTEPKKLEKEPAAQPANSASNSNCDPPYFFKDGIKTFRQECL